MSSTKEFKDFVIDQLSDLKNITCKSMMGEFLLYYNGILFGGIYDNRFLIKQTKSNKKFNLCTEIPYNNSKPMYMVEDIENKKYLINIITETTKDLIK